MPAIIFAAGIASQYAVELAVISGLTVNGLARKLAWWDIQRRELKSRQS